MKRYLYSASALVLAAPLILAAPAQAGGVSPGAAAGIGIGSFLLGGALGSMAAPPPAYAYPPPVYYAPRPRCWYQRVPLYDDWGNFMGYSRQRVCQ